MDDCKMMGKFYKQGKTKFMLTHVVKYGKSRFVLYVYTYFRFILFVFVTLKLAIILRLCRKMYYSFLEISDLGFPSSIHNRSGWWSVVL